ncbi:histidinol-phosphate transaminase [Kitasatospora sp. MAP5-34]|uniref:histidinol-phosphate transaminase n=1 Tax=Kitasatospora sp. MAP5-34 TaxID=3035102 RepID=UPI0024752D70|nr:histidinol-phosphate transaminase [Kitasatospora sp. MAP5-34]MDH6579060.1 histidinol-phosphate aminotransferase [Kitasatospora sp. MAP5-34]
MTHPRLRSAVTDAAPKPARPPGAAPVTHVPVTHVPVTHLLAANENPYPPLPSVREAVVAASGGLHRYPDMAVTELTTAIAERYGVPPEHVATGTGSVGIIKQLLQATCSEDDEVLYAWPSFEAYPHLAEIAGVRSVRVPLREYAHDLDALADAVTDRTGLVIVCNPNNPTGTVVRRAELERFLDRVPGDVLVVLDEAYREFVRDPEVPDGIELYRDRPNLAVLRTFSKAYGLAGLRVGFAVAHEPVAAALRACSVPFGITGIAQTAALASLRAETELMDRVSTLVDERDRVVAALRALGLPVPPTQANFFWLPLGDRATAFGEACAAAGVQVRAFPGVGVRVTIGEPAANDLVLEIAAKF